MDVGVCAKAEAKAELGRAVLAGVTSAGAAAAGDGGEGAQMGELLATLLAG